MTYIIDRDQVVHMAFCRDIVEPCLPYVSKVEDMHAWLSKPDFKDGYHAPPAVKACQSCITAI